MVELEEMELYGEVWSAEKNGKKIKWKYKHDEKMIIFKATDKDPELLGPLIEVAKEIGYAVIDVDSVKGELKEGVNEVLCWDYASEKHILIEVVLRKVGDEHGSK